jgi:hypothetical protein
MTFKYLATKICDYTNASTVTLVAALVYDAWAQTENNISCPEQQHAGRERKLVCFKCFPTMHSMFIYADQCFQCSQ